MLTLNQYKCSYLKITFYHTLKETPQNVVKRSYVFSVKLYLLEGLLSSGPSQTGLCCARTYCPPGTEWQRNRDKFCFFASMSCIIIIQKTHHLKSKDYSFKTLQSDQLTSWNLNTAFILRKLRPYQERRTRTGEVEKIVSKNEKMVVFLKTRVTESLCCIFYLVLMGQVQLTHSA